MNARAGSAVRSVSDYATWRQAARDLLQQGVAPAEVVWLDTRSDSLFCAPAEPTDALAEPAVTHTRAATGFRVSAAFVEMATAVSHHCRADRWALLYRILWRMRNGEPALIRLATDADIADLTRSFREVRRERHKMTAFVRFRKLVQQGQEFYVAWYQPVHPVLPLAAGHFRERFASMSWSIITPQESVHWDGRRLRFAPGAGRDACPTEDGLESLWLTYYSSIFNPARVRVAAMKKEMPVRYWQNLPEASLIPQLLDDAPQRTEEMVKKSIAAARKIELPVHIATAGTLAEVGAAARGCTMCPLYSHATQMVWGEGPASARLMLVGEQPGDTEDRAGRPFVGPAGKLLDEVLKEAGVDRASCYLTNAVKHFKFEPRGERRIHAKPSAREVNACKPWLLRELELVKPAVLVLLGATAARALLGNTFRLTEQRGEWFASDFAPQTVATYHPSALLRAPDAALAERMRQQMVADLRRAAEFL